MIISVEGNIGSGKSTLLATLKKTLGYYIGSGKHVVYVKEPVDEWNATKDSDGNSMLDLLYSDTKTHAFAFQMMAYITRLRALKKAREDYPDAILITERCLQTDAEVFARMLRDSNSIRDVHWQIYNKWAITLSPELEPDYYLYVRADPTTSYERVQKRARKSESAVSIEYLKNCHRMHEEWMNGMDASKRITFDADREFVGSEDGELRVKQLVEHMMRFIL